MSSGISSTMRYILKNTSKNYRKKQQTEGRTWDLRRGRKGNKKLTVKFFPEAPNIIVDIRVFNFHVETPLPNKFRI
jgi:Trm5-related predicted tRNA methylase